jgi:hypothetical protein
MSAEQFLQTLLSFGAKSLDMKQIKSIYDIFKETSHTSKTTTNNKTKRKPSARQLCWDEKKALGMDKAVFKLYWDTMSDEQKKKYEK